MLTALAAAVLVQPAFTATRFDMGERFKALDVAWMAADRARRREAVPHIAAGTAAFFGGGTGKVCRALDEAVAALEGRARRPEDALGFRFVPAYTEPGGKGRLRVTWCYDPESQAVVDVSGPGVRRSLAVGVPATLEIDSRRLNPDGREPEVGVLASLRAGSARRSAYISLVKALPKRVGRLSEAKNATAKSLGELVRSELAQPGETEVSLIDVLLLAEELETGETKIEDVEQPPTLRHRGTAIRAAIPKGLSGPSTVVVALHGAGGSENLFFESYGRGRAVQEALKRGWVLLSPRAGSTAIRDSLDWLREVRGVTASRLFVMGHSMGGALALGSGNIEPRPRALALFAPAAGSIPAALASVPVFVAVGKQEQPFLLRQARALASAPNVRLVEHDPCEHLMVVADALPEAFKFFDGLAGD